MNYIKAPSEISTTILTKGLIYGQPGVGKTTLALSSPDPVIIDADRGMYRVEKRFQVPSMPLNNYADLLAVMQSAELDPFKTIVFDTLGKLIDRMSEYVIAQNAKNGTAGGQLSMKGWGAVKVEFQNLLKIADSKGKHLVFVAHEKEEKDGENRIVRPDVSGSSGKDIVKELDYMGYCEMKGNLRTISFSPCEKFYAKNSLHLVPHIQLPDLENSPNDFIQRNIVDRTIERQKEEQQMSDKYDMLVANVKARIEQVANPEQANKILIEITEATVVWDSQRVLKRALLERTKEIGISYDREAKQFVAHPQQAASVSQTASAETTPATQPSQAAPVNTAAQPAEQPQPEQPAPQQPAAQVAPQATQPQ